MKSANSFFDTINLTQATKLTMQDKSPIYGNASPSSPELRKELLAACRNFDTIFKSDHADELEGRPLSGATAAASIHNDVYGCTLSLPYLELSPPRLLEDNAITQCEGITLNNERCRRSKTLPRAEAHLGYYCHSHTGQKPIPSKQKSNGALAFTIKAVPHIVL